MNARKLSRKASHRQSLAALRNAVTQYERDHGSLSICLSEQAATNCTANCSGTCDSNCYGTCTGMSASY
jgi:hypothetical protein